MIFWGFIFSQFLFKLINNIPDLYSALSCGTHSTALYIVTRYVVATWAQVHPLPVQIQHDLTRGTY